VWGVWGVGGPRLINYYLNLSSSEEKDEVCRQPCECVCVCVYVCVSVSVVLFECCRFPPSHPHGHSASVTLA
jgi:hypothetical protein